MGRIKQTMVKKAARELFEGSDGFSEDFERNKKLLKDMMPSKAVRNKVAGGIVRLATQKRKKEHERGRDTAGEQE
jgi:ribosomal protein S17E